MIQYLLVLGGGLTDSGNLACTDVSINNRDISFKIPSFSINYDLKTITILGFSVNNALSLVSSSFCSYNKY